MQDRQHNNSEQDAAGMNDAVVSATGNRSPCVPMSAVAMIGWHVARHRAAGDGEGARPVIKIKSTFSPLVM